MCNCHHCAQTDESHQPPQHSRNRKHIGRCRDWRRLIDIIFSCLDSHNSCNIASQSSAVVSLHSIGRCYLRYGSVHTSFHDWFVISRHFVFQMIGSATTYLVIMIQFDSVSVQANRNCLPQLNNTQYWLFSESLLRHRTKRSCQMDGWNRFFVTTALHWSYMNWAHSGIFVLHWIKLIHISQL